MASIGKFSSRISNIELQWNKNFPSPLRQKIVETLNLNAFTPAELINKILHKNPGIFLCDLHGHHNIPEFIAKSMPKLKQSGVNKIFMEMIPAEKQSMLDQFFDNGNNSDEVLDYFTEHWGNKSEGIAKKYFNIIKTAKENGIKVYGIDEPNVVYHSNTLSSRLERSNPYWKDVIVRNTNPNDKYIVYGGAGHAANYPANKGVDYMLGIPTISIETGTKQIIKGDGKSSDFIFYLDKSPEQPKSYF